VIVRDASPGGSWAGGSATEPTPTWCSALEYVLWGRDPDRDEPVFTDAPET
jgi:hypothetical protein